MRCLHLLGLFGVVVAGLVALAIGTRPALRAQQPPAAVGPALEGGTFGGMNIDPTMLEPLHVEAPPKTVDELKTWLKLQNKIAMNFPNDTPLEDVIKFIHQATIDEPIGLPKGIPIYIDPIGLKDSNQTMDSTIRLDLEGVPLETTLRLILKQLSLTYEITKDGLIVITATGCNEGMPLSEERANWHAFDALRSEVRALRQEVRELRRPEDRPMVPPVGLPKSALQGGMSGGFR